MIQVGGDEPSYVEWILAGQSVDNLSADGDEIRRARSKPVRNEFRRVSDNKEIGIDGSITKRRRRLALGQLRQLH